VANFKWPKHNGITSEVFWERDFGDAHDGGPMSVDATARCSLSGLINQGVQAPIEGLAAVEVIYRGHRNWEEANFLPQCEKDTQKLLQKTSWNCRRTKRIFQTWRTCLYTPFACAQSVFRYFTSHFRDRLQWSKLAAKAVGEFACHRPMTWFMVNWWGAFQLCKRSDGLKKSSRFCGLRVQSVPHRKKTTKSK